MRPLKNGVQKVAITRPDQVPRVKCDYAAEGIGPISRQRSSWERNVVDQALGSNYSLAKLEISVPPQTGA